MSEDGGNPHGQSVLAVVVAESAEFRAQLGSLLGRVPEIRVVFSGPFGESGPEGRPIDLAVLHPTSPAEQDECRRWRHRYPDAVTVIMLSEQSRECEPEKLNGVFDHESCVEDLPEKLSSILEIIRGSSRDSPASEAEAKQIGELSERELEVLRLTAEGLSVSEIAERLHRSVHTVTSHRQSLHRKLKMDNRVSLARFAIRNGLAEA